MSCLRIAWLSANKLGLKLLEETMKVEGIHVLGIYTLKKKAKTKMYDGVDLKKWYKFNIPVYEIENINDEDRKLKEMNLDFLVVCGWRQIINENILNIPKKGVIGFHPSRLPKGRGPAPIINTIFEEISVSGLTMYYLAKGLDDGDIIGQESFLIGENDYASDVYRKIILAGKKLIKKYLPLLKNDNAPRITQNKTDATFFQKRSIKENEIKITSDSADLIYKKIRAFSKPYNGAYFIHDGKKIIIWKAEIENI